MVHRQDRPADALHVYLLASFVIEVGAETQLVTARRPVFAPRHGQEPPSSRICSHHGGRTSLFRRSAILKTTSKGTPWTLRLNA